MLDVGEDITSLPLFLILPSSFSLSSSFATPTHYRMKLATLLAAAASLLCVAGAPTPFHLGECATPDFNHQLDALSATLGANGASLFPHLLTQLSATKAGCKAVYPLVTEAKTILAPQDSAVTADFISSLTADPRLVGEYVSGWPRNGYDQPRKLADARSPSTRPPRSSTAPTSSTRPTASSTLQPPTPSTGSAGWRRSGWRSRAPRLRRSSSRPTLPPRLAPRW